MSSHEDITSTRALDTLQEPQPKGSRPTTPVSGILVQFQAEDLRPRPRESAADWILRTRDNQQEVCAQWEKERSEGDPEKAQADWLKRWGFKSSEEADEIFKLPMFGRYDAFQKYHRKRAADDLQEPEARNIQPPLKKRKTVKFAEEHRYRLISPPVEVPEDVYSPASTKGLEEEESSEEEEVGDIPDALKEIARKEAKRRREDDRAKAWLVTKAYEPSSLEQDPSKVTLMQMREDNPSEQTLHARILARKRFRDDSCDPPLTPNDQFWAFTLPSHCGDEEDEEDVDDVGREADDDTDSLSDDEPSGPVVSFSRGSETEEPADRRETPEAGPSQSPVHKSRAEQVVEQSAQRRPNPINISEDSAVRETIAKRWLAQKALEISVWNPDPSLVTVEHMREGDPSEQTFQDRWMMHKKMKDDTRDPPLTPQERRYCLNIPPLIESPIRFEDIADLDIMPDLDDYDTPEEGASKSLVQDQDISRKRPASSMDDSEKRPSHSSVKRPRIDKGLRRERPVGWLLDSLGGQRRARRWLAEKAAKTPPPDMELTDKNRRILSMKQMADDYPNEITLWTRWATQKVMEDEIEDASQEQPTTAKEQSPASMEPGHPHDDNGIPPANINSNTDTRADDTINPEPSVPIVSPNLDTGAEPTPKPDPFEAIMKRLDDLERIVRETRAEQASQQASSTAPTKRGLGRPKKSGIVQRDDGERQSITVDEQADTASERNSATREKRIRPRRMEQPMAEPKGKGKVSDGQESTILPNQEQEQRRKPGRPRKDAQKKMGSSSKPTTKSAATPVTPTSNPETHRGRGRPRKEEPPVKEEASKKTGQVRMPTPTAAASKHKMRTRTQSPEEQ